MDIAYKNYGLHIQKQTTTNSFFCFLGRGRAKDSKIVMLAYGDSGHVKRERENAIRVQLTQDILSEIHSLPPNVLVKDVIVLGFRTSLLYRQ